MNVNMITCGGQATIPMVAAVSRARRGVVRRDRRLGLVGVRRARAPAPTSTSSPGPRRPASRRSAAPQRGKAIIILNPAEPPMIMRDTIFCAVAAGRRHATRSSQSIFAMEKAVQEYVPGYRLLQEPQIDEPSAATQGQTKVSVFVEVEGAGDYLPPYAGNLDIMTAAAAQVGENIARSILREALDMTDIEHPDPHLVRHPRRRALGRARPAAHRHLPARRVAPQAAPVHRAGGARHRRGARQLRRPGHRGDPRRRPRRLVVQLRLLARRPSRS